MFELLCLDSQTYFRKKKQLNYKRIIFYRFGITSESRPWETENMPNCRAWQIGRLGVKRISFKLFLLKISSSDAWELKHLVNPALARLKTLQLKNKRQEVLIQIVQGKSYFPMKATHDSIWFYEVLKTTQQWIFRKSGLIFNGSKSINAGLASHLRKYNKKHIIKTSNL